MNVDTDLPLLQDELALLESLCPLDNARLIELGCGAARLARTLLQRHPGTELVGLEVDTRQHAKNLAAPQERLTFLEGQAQRLDFAEASFDGALMLKSLHHVPMALMGQALDEVHRVLRPGGWLYVSEPIYDGALNELVRLYNDEGAVRAAAQSAVDAAVAKGRWTPVHEHRFASTVHFADFHEFETRMMRPTFADHHLTPALIDAVRQRFEPHQRGDGAHFVRPMHVRLLRRA